MLYTQLKLKITNGWIVQVIPTLIPPIPCYN